MEEIQGAGIPEKLELGGKFLVRLPEAELHREEVEDRQAEGYVAPPARGPAPAAAGLCQLLSQRRSPNQAQSLCTRKKNRACLSQPLAQSPQPTRQPRCLFRKTCCKPNP